MRTRRRSFGTVLVSAIAVLGLSVAGATTALAEDHGATETRASFEVCAQVPEDRQHDPDGPGEPLDDCRAAATTHPEEGQDESRTGTFCLEDNPIGVGVHFQDAETGDGRDGGDFTVTLIGPSPAEEAEETRDYAAFHTVTLGNLNPGDYEVTVEYHGQDGVAQPAKASITFTMTAGCEEEPEEVLLETRASFVVCGEIGEDPPTGIDPSPGDCGPPVSTHPMPDEENPEGDAGSFCLPDNPMGVLVHFQVDPDASHHAAGSGLEGGLFTVTLAGPNVGDSEIFVRDYAEFNGVTFGDLDPGDYEITVRFEGDARLTDRGDEVLIHQPNEITGTFTVHEDCPEEPEPPAPGMPGCGFGDPRHQHAGPPTNQHRFFPDVCPERAGRP